VRQQIRNGHPDFVITADFWPAFLYPVAVASDDVEDGLFRSAILVKVAAAFTCYLVDVANDVHCQGFKFLFTSPSSAEEISSENDIIGAGQTSERQKRQKGSRKAPTCGNVTNLLGIWSVSPRAIAYVAVQVCPPVHEHEQLTSFCQSLAALRNVKCNIME
jgi:hypothetical protein